jgi:hypothetical protein
VLVAEHSQRVTLGTSIAVAFPRSPAILPYILFISVNASASGAAYCTDAKRQRRTKTPLRPRIIFFKLFSLAQVATTEQFLNKNQAWAVSANEL